MKVILGVSKRHVHLTREIFISLFGEDVKLEKRNDLIQPGQYASKLTVDLRIGENIIEHVRVIGPLRDYTQVEISLSDASYLGVKPPKRQSGDLENSLPITLIGPCGECYIKKGLILAERHIHMNEEMLNRLGISDKDTLLVYKDNKFLFDAAVKLANPAELELHIDTDEALEYNLTSGEELEFEICGK